MGYGITIYYGEKNPFRTQMDYFLGTDWNMMVVDLVFGLFWIAIIFGFVTQLLLLYGIQKLNETFMLPHLILKMSGLFIGTIASIIFSIKKYMQNDTKYFVLYVSGYIFCLCTWILLLGRRLFS